VVCAVGVRTKIRRCEYHHEAAERGN
jgi:hypothetical protein